jgi:hypothetical protein
MFPLSFTSGFPKGQILYHSSNGRMQKTDAQPFYFIPQFQSRFCRAVATDKREILLSISINSNPKIPND